MLSVKLNLPAYQNYISMVKCILHSFDTKLLNNQLAMSSDHKHCRAVKTRDYPVTRSFCTLRNHVAQKESLGFSRV